jgi:monoamine oxidase
VIYDGNRDSPNAKTKVISLLVSGEDAERFNLMPLHAVEGRLRGEFEKLWPGFNRFIRGMEFYRFHPRAIAGWPVGRSRYDELSDAVRRPENRVYFAGDFTESTHSDGAFWSAWRVAQQIQATRVRNLAEKVRDLKKSGQKKDVKAATPGGLAQ